MLTADTARTFALALPETVEARHFDVVSFQVRKKLFATLNAPEKRATLRFSAEMQDIFSTIGKGAIFPVPNRWGTYGWTTVQLEHVDPELFRDALQIAWRHAAPAAFQKKYPEQYVDE